MELLLQALSDKYTHEKSQAIAELSILLQSPTGIAGHSNIIQECDSKIKAIAEAEDKYTVISKIIKQNTPKSQEGQ